MVDATHLYRGNDKGEILDADGRVVGRILAPSTIDDRTWREDFVHENGQYFCRCGVCDRDFVGLKRRLVCKVCAAPADWTAVAVKGGYAYGYRDAMNDAMNNGMEFVRKFFEPDAIMGGKK